MEADDYKSTVAPLSDGDRIHLIFRELSSDLAGAGETHPSARVWRHSDLVAKISGIANAHVDKLTTNFPPAREVIDRMLQIGWAKPLTTETPPGKKPEVLYLLDMEAGPDELPGVPELLQGFEPAGVLCYFGALEFHELTTQVPAFYHIARLEEPRTSGPSPTPRIEPQAASGPPRKPRDPLGTLRFHYQGVPCYSTRRDRTLVPGVQLRQQGPRTLLRTTTLEQTLLDTLLHPLRCGGESTVFEAWERGISRWNPERLERHLAEIGRDDFERRVGAMLDFLDASAGPVLATRLNASKERRRQSDEATPIPLLHGFEYPRVSADWGVTLP